MFRVNLGIDQLKSLKEQNQNVRCQIEAGFGGNEKCSAEGFYFQC
jgi:hypothetical protein